MSRSTIIILWILLTIVGITGCSKESTGDILHLEGTWKLALMEGQQEAEQLDVQSVLFNSEMSLPGTTDEAEKGIRNSDSTNLISLTRRYLFEGFAFYQREIIIPDSWDGKRIVLHMERTRKSHVYVDDVHVGSESHYSVPHEYDLADKLDPGKHILTIAVDNTLEGWHTAGSHSTSDHTQTNWNGILGEFYLESTPTVHISNIGIVPGPDHSATIRVRLAGEYQITETSFLHIDVSLGGSKITSVRQAIDPGSMNANHSFDLDLGKEMQHWDEFNPAVYTARITLETEMGKHTVQEDFGMITFETDRRRFIANGNTVFLRGKHDGCVFPLSGYAPMEVDDWMRVMSVARDWGINHYRFHSWCPPEAAFIAADRLGIYLQPELPLWGGLQIAENKMSFTDPNEDAFGITEAELFAIREGKGIIDKYGNHPSFCMFALGNELQGNRHVMQRIIDSLRAYDGSRRLFAQGSNNHFKDARPGQRDDYWTTVRTSPRTPSDYSNVVRASFSYTSQDLSGPINAYRPSTKLVFTEALDNVRIPVIGHETGQYQYFPDYSEVEKYTGVLAPINLEVSRSILDRRGLSGQIDDFASAVGKWASILYCEDMESVFRTPEMAGFQLLDLQDYPGQGPALVGPLDAFMDNKGHISPEKWKMYCNELVILAEFDDYIIGEGEVFRSAIRVANYGPKTLDGINMEVRLGNHTKSYQNITLEQGVLTEVGWFELHLDEIGALPRKELLTIEIPDLDLIKDYPLWIFPKDIRTEIPENLLVTRSFDTETVELLEAGARVLYIPEHQEIEGISIGGLFMTDYWSWTMFKKISERNKRPVSPGSLGLLIQNEHPALSGFPTEYHSNWQWWSLTMNSRPIILDEAPEDYRPIVQTIDNMWRNHRLGTLFEFRVGKGALLVCAVDLEAMKATIVARAFYASLLEYASGDQFRPTVRLNSEDPLMIKLIQ